MWRAPNDDDIHCCDQQQSQRISKAVSIHFSLLEQIGMRTGAHEYDQAMFSVVIELVGQQKITADMALPIPFPVDAQWVIKPFRSKRGIVGDQQEHGFLEPVHVVPASSR